MPSELIPQLLHRFWSDEGYMLLPDVPLVLRGVRNLQTLRYDRVVVGVITNSDDRVPDILTSLGLKVRPLRYGTRQQDLESHSGNCDIDFAIISYDVGHEKPDKRIFSAAEDMLKVVLDNWPAPADPVSWEKIYVGDEYDKDIIGAGNAGWSAVLISEEAQADAGKIQWQADKKPSSLQDLFQPSSAVGFRSLTRFAEWLR